jgi:rubredoxin
MARKGKKPAPRAPEETTIAAGPAETPETAAPEVWVCPKCGSSYRTDREPVAIANHKVWHGVT